MSTKAKKNYNTFNFKPKDTLLFGRESEGVPKMVHKNVTFRSHQKSKKNMQLSECDARNLLTKSTTRGFFCSVRIATVNCVVDFLWCCDFLPA